MIFLILLLCLTSTCFIGNSQLIFWSRLPIFAIGVLFGVISTKQETLTFKNILFLVLAMIMGLLTLYLCIQYKQNLLWDFGLWWYPFILVTPGLCLVISIIANIISKTRAVFLIKFAEKIGSNTFSLYLSHIVAFEAIRFIAKTHTELKSSIISIIIVALVSIIGAIILTVLTNMVKKKLNLLPKK